MVDAADPEKIEASKNELHNLLDKPQLQGIPVRAPAMLIMTTAVYLLGLLNCVSQFNRLNLLNQK